MNAQGPRHASRNTPKIRHVLGVERDPELMAAAQSLLQELGFQVVIATTQRGAQAACRARHFELMIIGSSIPRSTADALMRFVARCGGPPSVRLRECRGADDHADMLSMLCDALAT